MLLVARCFASVSSGAANAGCRTTSASSASAAGNRAATASVVTSVRSGNARASSVAPSASSVNPISFALRFALPRVSKDAVNEATPGIASGSATAPPGNVRSAATSAFPGTRTATTRNPLGSTVATGVGYCTARAGPGGGGVLVAPGTI